jgi:uncharacterized protein YyaL (SSP411 family)
MSHGRLRSARYIVRKAGTAVWLALIILPFAARSENRLAEEKSPYLLQHRDNPVDWYPWGKEAFDRARRESKPVFVSIGYSTCHWCHVMARESFENPQTAKLLNEHFVNVKVDREERPDVDRFCMAFVQASGGSGGWPMNVWMTPEGEPFFGGTYFPPDDRPGQPGFPSVIRLVAEGWKSSEVEIRAHGGKVIDALRSSAAPPASEVSEDILSSAYKEFVRNYDPEWGGFGRGEQFPRASVFNFLLRLHATAPASPEGKAALEMIRNTLHKMASGGIRDHIGGGFHRYAVDRAWRVPHFEKMLCDQAQLAVSYCEAWQVIGDPLFLDVARDTLEYVLRELTHPEGGFFSAEDAESLVAHGGGRQAEGAFYLWTAAKISDALSPEDARLFALHYGVQSAGNVPDAYDPRGEFRGRNVLVERQSVAESARQLGLTEDAARQSLASSNERLFALRESRPPPGRDEKVLAGWNGLMISAFAQVGVALNDARYARAASNAARFVRNHLYDAKSGTLRRSWKEGTAQIPGFAEDYAFLIQALLDLYQASADSQALDWAIALQRKQDELFWDASSGGYFESSAEDQLVKVRLKQDYDGAEPSANSVSALNLLRLSRMLHQEHYANRAKDIFSTFSDALQNAHATVPQMLAALQFSRSKPRQAVIAGDPRQQATRLLVHSILRDFHPDLVVLYAEDANALSGDAAQALAAMRPIQGRPALYLCENFTCRAPVTSPEDARRLLDHIQDKSLD